MLEFGGLAGIGEGYVGDEAPRFEFCRVRGLTGIVLGQALFQICRDADVAPALAARTYQQIDVMHSRRVGTPIASGVRIFRPLNEGDSDNYAALLRASEGTLRNASVRRVTQGGGDGLLSSARRDCFSKALDIRSANSSSCPQVFHRERDSLRPTRRPVVRVRAHACDAAHHFNTILPFRLPAHVALPFLLTAGALHGRERFHRVKLGAFECGCISPIYRPAPLRTT